MKFRVTIERDCLSYEPTDRRRWEPRIVDVREFSSYAKAETWAKRVTGDGLQWTITWTTVGA